MKQFNITKFYKYASNYTPKKGLGGMRLQELKRLLTSAKQATKPNKKYIKSLEMLINVRRKKKV